MAAEALIQCTSLARRAIYAAAAAVTVAATAVIGATLLLGVIVRYVLSGSLAWASELPVLLFPWLIMAGIVLAAARDEHLGVDFFARRLPAGWQVALQLLVLAGIAGLMLAMAAQAPSLLEFMQYRLTPVLRWPSSWAFYSVPLGTVAVAVLALLRMVEIAVQALARREVAA